MRMVMCLCSRYSDMHARRGVANWPQRWRKGRREVMRFGQLQHAAGRSQWINARRPIARQEWPHQAVHACTQWCSQSLTVSPT